MPHHFTVHLYLIDSKHTTSILDGTSATLNRNPAQEGFGSLEESGKFHASAGRAGVLLFAAIGFGSRAADTESALAAHALSLQDAHWLHNRVSDKNTQAAYWLRV